MNYWVLTLRAQKRLNERLRTGDLQPEFLDKAFYDATRWTPDHPFHLKLRDSIEKLARDALKSDAHGNYNHGEIKQRL